MSSSVYPEPIFSEDTMTNDCIDYLQSKRYRVTLKVARERVLRRLWTKKAEADIVETNDE